MENKPGFSATTKFQCSRCGAAIRPEEKVFESTAIRDTADGDIEYVGHSRLCFSCAGVLLTKAVVSEELAVPPASKEWTAARDEESDMDKFKVVVDSDGDEGGEAKLVAYCSKTGLYFRLHCYEKDSWATGPFFTWKQIAQMVIAMDPDLFGRIDEPLHRVFPENLERLGYCVPGWQK